jgi:uncharacterized protein with PhoU and TrkA domain
MPLRWNATRLDQLESAVRRGKRVSLMRRGTEYVVTAVRLTTRENRDALVGRHPMTGEELEFLLEDVDGFEVVGE